MDLTGFFGKLYQKLSSIVRHPVCRISMAVVVATFLGAVVYLHESGDMSPGPLSAASMGDMELGGYHSHAAFEKECNHCHVPVHCISETGCQDCHLEVAQQRDTASGLHGRLAGTSRCQTCHKEHRGPEADITEFAFVNVDHQGMTDFSLVNHRNDYDGNPMSCESCHSQDRYVQETLDCLSCHAQADHDFLAGHMELYGSDCLQCHDGQGHMADFNHDLVFSLQAGHQDVACETCHLDQVFGGLPSDCSSCHQEPEVHLAQFGLDCARCHTTGVWKPAHLKEHNFDLSHSGEENLECESCHTNQTYAEYSCAECHEPDEMVTKHEEQGITDNIDICGDCHVTGEPGEGEQLALGE